MATSSARKKVKETPEQREKQTTERLWMVFTGLVAGHAVLLGSLYRVQIARNKELSRESRKRWQYTDKTLPATRGLIFDRKGNLLVQNEAGYSVIVDPNEWFDSQTATDTATTRRMRTLLVLKEIFPEEDFSDLEELDLSKPPQEPYPHHDVRYWVPESVVERIRQVAADHSTPVKKTKGRDKDSLPQAVADLPGVGFGRTARRAALNGTLAAHVLGFTDITGKQAWRGVEASQNKRLAGEIGHASYQFDLITMIPGTAVFQKKKENGVTKSAQRVHGSHLTLTLDSELQHDAEKAIGAAVKKHRAEAGVAIILEAKTGNVLAMACAPTYNVNAARTTKSASEQEVAARANWALENPYEPGSTLKTFTLAAALEAQKVSLNSLFYCNAAHKIGRDTIHCAPHGKFQHGHGQEDLTQVLTNSCNLATAECGSLLGPNKLYEFLTAAGLGRRTGVGLPGESPGKLRNPQKSVWQPIDLANISFGQGMSVTPLQLAAAYTIFVDGKYRAPRLIHSFRSPETNRETLNPLVAPKPVLSEKTAAQLRVMLGSVVEHGTGIAAQVNGYSVGGKTGTAQIFEHGGYRGRYVASFVGVAPLDKPEFVILTMVRDPKAGDHYGGSVAGPIFKELAEKALLQSRIAHDRTLQSAQDALAKQRALANAIE